MPLAPVMAAFLAIVPAVKATMNSRGPGTGGYCDGLSCAGEISEAIAAVSGRWAIQVIEGLHFAGGASRFRELQRRIGAISSKELSRQLGTLVAHGVVERDARIPGNVSYELTAAGRRLMRHMEALGEWARSRDAEAPAVAGNGGSASWLGPICGTRPARRPAR